MISIKVGCRSMYRTCFVYTKNNGGIINVNLSIFQFAGPAAWRLRVVMGRSIPVRNPSLLADEDWAIENERATAT